MVWIGMLHDDAAEESFTVQNNTTAAREAITAAVASPYGARLVLLSPFSSFFHWHEAARPGLIWKQICLGPFFIPFDFNH